jgi:hypothetical protein
VTAAVDDAAIPEPVLAAWQRALDAWDDPARHDALFGAVAQHNCFAWAAARYKQKADDPIAAARLVKLRRASEAALLATAMARPTERQDRIRSTFRLFAIAMVVLVVFLLVSAYVTVRGTHRGADDSNGRIVPAQPASP